MHFFQNYFLIYSYVIFASFYIKKSYLCLDLKCWADLTFLPSLLKRGSLTIPLHEEKNEKHLSRGSRMLHLKLWGFSDSSVSK